MTMKNKAKHRSKQTHYSIYFCIGVAILALCSTADATTFTFNSDPFAGTPVLTIPGRQIVGGEDFLSFNISTDVFSLESTVFGVGSTVNFVNAAAGNLPSGGVNVVVLQTFDNDNNPLTPFGASNAADLIASRITTPGPGFFVYFNQSLDLPRLVYSTDLSDNNSDLKILARMLNLPGQEGRNAIPTFTAANFEITTATPEPSTFSMIACVAVIGACFYLVRRKWSLSRTGPRCAGPLTLVRENSVGRQAISFSGLRFRLWPRRCWPGIPTRPNSEFTNNLVLEENDIQ